MHCEIRDRLIAEWNAAKEAQSEALCLLKGAGGVPLRIAREKISAAIAERDRVMQEMDSHLKEHGCG